MNPTFHQTRTYVLHYSQTERNRHLLPTTMMSCTNTIMLLLILTFFSPLQHFSVSSFEYQVGGNTLWVVPPSNHTTIYNLWASDNRFQIGDTVRFKYRKDSVMEVSEEDYNKCNSSHPSFFSNTGNTVYKLDHPGAFYFISGVSGHCEKGQKMIIKVMYPEDEYISNASSHGGAKISAASPTSAMLLSFGVSINLGILVLQLFLSYVFAVY